MWYINNNNCGLVLVLSYWNYDRLVAVGLYGVFDIGGVGWQKRLVRQRRQQQRVPLVGAVVTAAVVVATSVSVIGQEQLVRPLGPVCRLRRRRCCGRRKFRRRRRWRRRAVQVHVPFGHMGRRVLVFWFTKIARDAPT